MLKKICDNNLFSQVSQMILNRTSKVKQVLLWVYREFPHIYLYKRMKGDDMETGSNRYDNQNT